MILKFQLPLDYTGGNALVLTYNEDRSLDGAFDLNAKQIKQLFGKGRSRQYKVYADCEIVDGQLEVNDLLEWQDW